MQYSAIQEESSKWYKTDILEWRPMEEEETAEGKKESNWQIDFPMQGNIMKSWI